MISTYLVPLVNVPQTFNIDLVGITYSLTCKWNDIMSTQDANDTGWVLDISDSQQNPIVCGIPLITGEDLLQGLSYLGIQGTLIVYTNGDANAVPTLNNLGTDCNLYFNSSVANGG